jgi:putative DNA primase/helicase
MTARFMYSEFFDFFMAGKLWLGTNHVPVIRGTDKAIWDRVRLIPFEVRIPEEKQDKTLLEKLQGELPGILRWAVQGCLSWQREGLGWPGKVVKATSDYRYNMDVLNSFMDECCSFGSTERSRSSALYARYCTWAAGNGERTISQREFSSRLEEKGFQREKTRNGAFWQGLGLWSVTDVTDVTD